MAGRRDDVWEKGAAGSAWEAREWCQRSRPARCSSDDFVSRQLDHGRGRWNVGQRKIASTADVVSGSVDAH